MNKKTKTLKKKVFSIVTGENSVELIQWMSDYSFSVHARLPDLPDVGIQDPHYEANNYHMAVEEYTRRVEVLSQLKMVKEEDDGDDTDGPV